MKHIIGVIHGRFQVFHLDHLNYVLSGMEKVDFMYIGITNPDPFLTRPDSSDLNRSLPHSNPCTYYERLQMIKGALFESEYKSDQFCIVPFPINFPETWQHYVPLDAIYFMSIYDDWGKKKLELFQSRGMKTHVLRCKRIEDKGISGTDVRNRIANDDKWEDMVPQATIGVIKEFRIQHRIKTMEKIDNASLPT